MKTKEEILAKLINDEGLKTWEAHTDKFNRMIAFKAMEEYANQSKWLSVDDAAKPKKFKNVLVLGDKKTIAIEFIDSSGAFDDYQMIEGEKITHWQPLPDLIGLARNGIDI